MPSLRRQIASAFAVLIAGLLIYAPVFSSQRRPQGIAGSLSVSQKAESLYQNGLRNSYRRNDVYGQNQILRRTLRDIRALRAANPKQLAKDEKAMDLRERALR